MSIISIFPTDAALSQLLGIITQHESACFSAEVTALEQWASQPAERRISPCDMIEDLHQMQRKASKVQAHLTRAYNAINKL